MKCLAVKNYTRNTYVVDRADSEPELDQKEEYSDINSGDESLEEEAEIFSNFHPIGNNLVIFHPA